MDASETMRSSTRPAAVYSERLEALERAQSQERRREKLLGYAKLALAAITIVAAALLLRHLRAIELLLVPVAGFIVLAVLHENVLRSIRMRARSINFYERGLARLEYRWAGTGETGERFLDPSHPCSNCCARRARVPAKRRWPRGCWLLRPSMKSSSARLQSVTSHLVSAFASGCSLWLKRCASACALTRLPHGARECRCSRHSPRALSRRRLACSGWRAWRAGRCGAWAMRLPSCRSLILRGRINCTRGSSVLPEQLSEPPKTWRSWPAFYPSSSASSSPPRSCSPYRPRSPAMGSRHRPPYANLRGSLRHSGRATACSGARLTCSHSGVRNWCSRPE
jgi:hypothetical protein